MRFLALCRLLTASSSSSSSKRDASAAPAAAVASLRGRLAWVRAAFAGCTMHQCLGAAGWPCCCMAAGSCVVLGSCTPAVQSAALCFMFMHISRQQVPVQNCLDLSCEGCCKYDNYTSSECASAARAACCRRHERCHVLAADVTILPARAALFVRFAAAIGFDVSFQLGLLCFPP